MKNKIKKWHIALMSFVTLFITLFASFFNLKADPVNENTEEWEISLSLYDSSINNERTPLTETNWNSVSDTESRSFTLQFNYKLLNPQKEYQPGEIQIKVDSLSKIFYKKYTGDLDGIRNGFEAASIAADKKTDVNKIYEWSYELIKGNWNPDTHQFEDEYYIFTNNNVLELDTNFEGHIQMSFSVRSSNIIQDSEAIFSASLNNVPTNVIKIKANANYKTHTLTKTTGKITSYDGLPSGATNYTWIKYTFSAKYETNNTIYGYDTYIKDIFPEGTIVLNESLQEVSPINNTGEYHFPINFTKATNIYVGYMTEQYEDTVFTNTAYLYGKYAICASDIDFLLMNKEPELLAEDDINIVFNDFKFKYNGELYGIKKNNYSYSSLSYNVLISDLAQTRQNFSIKTLCYYTGEPMTIRIYDDFVFISNNQGGYDKLLDTEYYFSKITIPSLSNGNNQKIPASKYDIELYVRYAGSNEYVKYGDTFKNQTTSTSFYFTESQKVVSWYIQINDMVESISMQSSYSGIETTLHVIQKTNIPTRGAIYNFSALEVYFKDTQGNLVLQNIVDYDSYDSSVSKAYISALDIQTYGHYMQRSAIYQDYAEDFYTFPIDKTSNFNIINNKEENRVDIKYNFRISKSKGQSIQDLTGYKFYDLLPEGMEITKDNLLEEIKESISVNSINNTYGICPEAVALLEDNNFTTEEDYKNYLKERVSITIKENWNNTNRTWIEIYFNFTDKPLILSRVNYVETEGIGYSLFQFNLNTYVSYESILEYGKSYDNYIYVQPFSSNPFTYKVPVMESGSSKGFGALKDDGIKDINAKDINENNNTEELILVTLSKSTINTAVSSHQSVQKQVKTDYNNFTTGIADTLCNSEYTYKLKVQTGSSAITNLKIYDILEEAQAGKTRWKGEFLGIDTSYAESKGYNVKPYYSENSKANSLYNEDGTLNSEWKEYVSDTPEIIANGLAITFDENFKTYNYNDYLYIYYYYKGYLYRSDRYYNTTLAGQTIEIPSTNVYFYWYTSAYDNNAYGFKINNIEPKVVTEIIGTTSSSLPINVTAKLSGTNYPESNHNPYNDNEEKLWQYTYTDNLVLQEFVPGTDKTKVKALAFEFLNDLGNPAIIPANSLTYVLINMKSPLDKNITTLARNDCRTEWNVISESGQIIDGIVGINSNIVKVALPNSVKEDSSPSISLRFTKEINGTDVEFENMKLDKAAQQIFMIRLTSLTANDDGSYNQIAALLKSNQELIISQIPVGTYLLEELGDNYFDFVNFTDNNDPEIVIEGVTFERTDQGYIITVSEDLTENIEFNIKVTNEIEPERFYEDKENKENIFLKTKLIENN